MEEYIKKEISEKQLEDLIRQKPHLVEDGLKYITHQQPTDRGPLDVLLVDSGKALVVAELKVAEDDRMLTQGIDYYDYITGHLESIARLYKKFNIDPKQNPRLFLIAPSFSMGFLNRCKWIDIPISLFTFQCIEFENKKGKIVPIFNETTIPSLPEKIEVYSLEDQLNYITDTKLRALAKNFLDEVKQWDPSRVSIDPIKYAISLKVSGSVFAYFGARRRYFLISANNSEGEWTNYPIKQKEDLEDAKKIVKMNFDKFG